MNGYSSRCTLVEHYKDFKSRAQSPYLNRFEGVPPGLQSSFKKLCEMTGTPYGCPITICMDWFDMFYVPQEMLDTWLGLAHVFAQENVPNVLAGPTMLDILSNNFGFPETIHCAGSPKVQAQEGELQYNRCGYHLGKAESPMYYTHLTYLQTYIEEMKL
jgi:hypothetical protein